MNAVLTRPLLLLLDNGKRSLVPMEREAVERIGNFIGATVVELEGKEEEAANKRKP